jgi:hypothetical protein
MKVKSRKPRRDEKKLPDQQTDMKLESTKVSEVGE